MTPRRFFALLSFVCLIAPIAQAAEPAPQPVGETVRCPVCGMYPARYPQWMAQVVFNDASASASSFDSPVEMFRFLGAMAKYDKRHTAADIGAIYVANHGGKGWLDAKQAWFVFGSKVRGPMNDPNAPAFATQAAAEAFVKERGGRVLRFAEVTPAVIDGESNGHDHGKHHQH